MLDLVFSSEPDMVEDLFVDCPVANSDHKVCVWIINCKVDEDRLEQSSFMYHKGNYSEIVKELNGIDCDENFRYKSVSSMWNCFREIVLHVRDKFVPVRRVRVGGKKDEV